MVLFQIDLMGVAVLEGEGDAPRPIDVDGISRRLEPAERVKVEAREVHVLRDRNGIETRQTPLYPLMQPEIDPRALPLDP